MRGCPGQATGHERLHVIGVDVGKDGAASSGHATAAMTNHALAYGFSRGFVVSAGITLLTLVVALVMLRVKREDLVGINPMAAPAG